MKEPLQTGRLAAEFHLICSQGLKLSLDVEDADASVTKSVTGPSVAGVVARVDAVVTTTDDAVVVDAVVDGVLRVEVSAVVLTTVDDAVLDTVIGVVLEVEVDVVAPPPLDGSGTRSSRLAQHLTPPRASGCPIRASVGTHCSGTELRPLSLPGTKSRWPGVDPQASSVHTANRSRLQPPPRAAFRRSSSAVQSRPPVARQTSAALDHVTARLHSLLVRIELKHTVSRRFACQPGWSHTRSKPSTTGTARPLQDRSDRPV